MLNTYGVRGSRVEHESNAREIKKKKLEESLNGKEQKVKKFRVTLESLEKVILGLEYTTEVFLLSKHVNLGRKTSFSFCRTTVPRMHWETADQ